MMDWIRHVFFGTPPPRPQADPELFRRREAELRERHERLERLAVESDVISRTDRTEDEPWAT